VAVSAAGSIAYFSERPTVDMLGINDRHIAHHGQVDHSYGVAHKRHDAKYVLDRAPAFIVLNSTVERGDPLTDRSSRLLNDRVEMGRLVSNEALLRDERFWTNYTRVRILAMDQINVVVLRNDKVPALVAEGLIEVVEVAGATKP
jgi:hypothetical protein